MLVVGDTRTLKCVYFGFHMHSSVKQCDFSRTTNDQPLSTYYSASLYLKSKNNSKSPEYHHAPVTMVTFVTMNTQKPTLKALTAYTTKE